MSRITMTVVLMVAAFATLGAAQPADQEPPAIPESARRAIALAEKAERDGRFETAALNYLLAHALAPEAPGVRNAIERLAGRVIIVPPNEGPRPSLGRDGAEEIQRERQAREALATEVELIERSLDNVTDQLERITRDLDDQFHAEPLAQRLDREIDDLERTVSEQQREIDRMRREIDRLWARVGR